MLSRKESESKWKIVELQNFSKQFVDWNLNKHLRALCASLLHTLRKSFHYDFRFFRSSKQIIFWTSYIFLRAFKSFFLSTEYLSIVTQHFDFPVSQFLLLSNKKKNNSRFFNWKTLARLRMMHRYCSCEVIEVDLKVFFSPLNKTLLGSNFE